MLALDVSIATNRLITETLSLSSRAKEVRIRHGWRDDPKCAAGGTSALMRWQHLDEVGLGPGQEIAREKAGGLGVRLVVEVRDFDACRLMERVSRDQDLRGACSSLGT